MTISFRPLDGTFGAEVLGVDPSQQLDASTKDILREAFDKYDMLILRDAQLDAAQQARFSQIFGPPAPAPVVIGAPAPVEADTQYVSNNRSDGIIPEGEMAFHMDHVFDEDPLRIIMLYGIEVPGTGGATKFRATNDIYHSLDDDLREEAEATRCLHLFDFNSEGVKGEGGKPAPWDESLEGGRSPFSLETASPGAPRAWQPLIWHNPRTGKPAVWCNPGTTIAFEDKSVDEGYDLLGRIQRKAAGVQEYAHDWRQGDLVLWNNLTLQHARTNFDPTEKRTLRRSALM